MQLLFASSTLAGTITAVSTMLTAVIGLAVIVITSWTRREIRSVHTIVNQQRTDSLNFQRALIRALVDAGVEVPVDQSLPSAD